MKRKYTVLYLILLFAAILLSSCAKEPPKPEGALSAAELLTDPIYDSEIKVYGQVSGLGEFECPCFALKSEEDRIYVWYDMMAEDDGSANPPTRPPIDVEGIKNDDWIVVTGELKYYENRKVLEDFWLAEFEIIR
jgi:hypothetical protein